jgi:hypothetical protein
MFKKQIQQMESTGNKIVSSLLTGIVVSVVALFVSVVALIVAVRGS